jgi:hypothetical protein
VELRSADLAESIAPAHVVFDGAGKQLDFLRQIARTPMIEAKVIYLSADLVSDHSARRINEADAIKRDTFIVRVQLDEQDMHDKIEKFRPTPGMPADVFIETGQRTFFNYLMRPVFDSLSRAFREH